MRKSVILLSAAGLGAGLVYLISRASQSTATNKQVSGSSMRPAEGLDAGLDGERPTSGNGLNAAGEAQTSESIVIDDQGTDQFAASNILKQIRDAAFDSDDEKLALALGRPAEEIEAWTTGSGVIDGDVIMKARSLALTRGIEIE